jgi:1-deoxy-D-xylulose-5-phosphate reductoisomerase
LAYEALAAGGTAPAVLSAANEVAVAAYVAGEIFFGEIPVCIETTLNRVARDNVSLEAVRNADRLARIEARAFTSDRTARTSRST